MLTMVINEVCWWTKRLKLYARGRDVGRYRERWIGLFCPFCAGRVGLGRVCGSSSHTPTRLDRRQSLSPPLGRCGSYDRVASCVGSNETDTSYKLFILMRAYYAE